MPWWMMTKSAAAYQARHVAELVAAGQWTGPRPSPQVLELAAMFQAAPERLVLAA